MRVAFGFKAHSGWAALVVIGQDGRELLVIDRTRIELVEETWAKQPYHAAESTKPEIARNLVNRGIAAANRIAASKIRLSVKREKDRGNTVVGCGVLVGEPMPDWSVDQILAVHFRMHKAEGVLFKDALSRGAKAAGLRLFEVPEKTLPAYAESALKISPQSLLEKITALGKSVGPPWGKDQKEAAVAAMIALKGTRA